MEVVWLVAEYFFFLENSWLVDFQDFHRNDIIWTVDELDRWRQSIWGWKEFNEAKVLLSCSHKSPHQITFFCADLLQVLSVADCVYKKKQLQQGETIVHFFFKRTLCGNIIILSFDKKEAGTSTDMMSFSFTWSRLWCGWEGYQQQRVQYVEGTHKI